MGQSSSADLQRLGPLLYTWPLSSETYGTRTLRRHSQNSVVVRGQRASYSSQAALWYEGPLLRSASLLWPTYKTHSHSFYPAHGPLTNTSKEGLHQPRLSPKSQLVWSLWLPLELDSKGDGHAVVNGSHYFKTKDGFYISLSLVTRLSI